MKCLLQVSLFAGVFTLTQPAMAHETKAQATATPTSGVSAQAQPAVAVVEQFSKALKAADFDHVRALLAKKNPVQFQPGLSLPAFLARYGSEEQCREALIQQRWPKGFCCPECGHTGHCQLKARAVFQCNRCKRQVSLTSGTLFADTKLPLRIWFLAIYLLTQHKNGISALALCRQLGVSYNTAWLVKHKLMQAMVERDQDRPLRGRVQMDDAYWGGERHGGGTGRGSPGKTVAARS